MEKAEKYVTILSGLLTIITSIITIFSGINDNILIFILGILFTLLFMYIFIKIKKRPKFTEIEKMRIDEADNLPIFVPKRNQLNPLIVTHICEIDGNDAILEYQYLGVCVDKHGMDKFSTGLYSHDITELENMDWYAYDLKNDPQRKRKIKPQLQNPDGPTKKVIFNFHRRIKFNELCSYFTHQKITNSVREIGKDCFVSTVLYKNRPLCDYKVILKFHKIKPSSINVYSVKNKKGTYLYSLLDDKNMTNENGIYTYTDNIENETAWSIRVYIFNRETTS